MKYYLTIITNEILPPTMENSMDVIHAITLINFERITLNERRQIQKTIYDSVYVKCPE